MQPSSNLASFIRRSCPTLALDVATIIGSHGTRILPGATTKLADLHLLGANCHRMVHARRPWLTLEQLKACVGNGRIYGDRSL